MKEILVVILTHKKFGINENKKMMKRIWKLIKYVINKERNKKNWRCLYRNSFMNVQNQTLMNIEYIWNNYILKTNKS